MLQRFTTLIPVLALAASPALAQGGFLGVGLEPAPEGASGARIAAVQERSAASIMGLQAGDLVTAVDGIAVADADALSALIRARLPGDIVELEVQRAGAPQKVLGVLARRPDAPGSRLPRAVQPGQPGLRSVPEFVVPSFEIPEFRIPEFQIPEFQIPEMQLHFPEFQLQREQMLKDFQERMQQFEMRRLPGGEGFSFRFDGAPGGIWLAPGTPLTAGEGTRIQLRYPESTSPEDRERLRREAIEKYGEQVEVEFAGTGSSVTIQRHSTQAAEPPAPSDPAPAPDGNREF